MTAEAQNLQTFRDNELIILINRLNECRENPAAHCTFGSLGAVIGEDEAAVSYSRFGLDESGEFAEIRLRDYVYALPGGITSPLDLSELRILLAYYGAET